MHRLAVFALTFFVLFTSALPPSLAYVRRETNADRFRRGLSPLPPVRRGAAYPPQPSSKPPPTVSGTLVIRDLSGLHVLGYVQNAASRSPIIGVSPANSPDSARLQATFSGSEYTVEATNALFPAPYYLGTTFPSPNAPGEAPPEELEFTNVGDIAGAKVWSYQPSTGELTIALPKPNGGTVPAVFAWDTYQNAIELVTDVPTFLAATAKSEPPDQQPVLVRVYLA